MTTLAFSTDYVQLPADGAGKRSSYYRFDTGGGDYLYLGAGVIVGATGIIADVDASGLKVNLGADNDVTVTGSVAVTNAGLTTLAGAVSGSEMQVDVVASLPAGNNNIGDVDVASLPALVAGTANIGDVDVLTVPAPLSTTGGGTEAAALRVTVANDSTGVLSIDDNGGSLTVDGTVAVTAAGLTELENAIAGNEMQVDVITLPPLVAGTANIGDVDVLTVPAPLSTTGGGTEATALRVTVANDSTGVVSIDDNGGSLTIDGTVTVGTMAALVAGSANIGDVDIASVAAGTQIEVIGDVASDVPIAANPVTIGARASTAQPTDVGTDGDAVNLWATRKGSLMVAPVPHAGLDGSPFNLTSKTVQVTAAQTGTDIWSPTSGKKLCIVSYQIQAFSTTAGTCIIWFGANADTTYSRGTDLAIFDGEFKPSSTLAPGVVQTGIWIASAVDHEVHLTSVGDVDLTVTLWGYEI